MREESSRPVEGHKELNELLSKLISKFEAYEGTSYDFARINDTYKNGLMGGSIGFELEIELLEGKFKLGQDRSPADEESLLKKLGEAKAPLLSANSQQTSTSGRARPDLP
jgi:transcriptional regulator